MNKRITALLSAIVFLLAAGPLIAQDEQVLDNGLVRVTFDQHTDPSGRCPSQEA